MSIQVNTGANAVNWETLLSKLGDVQKTTGADGKEAFTITTKVDGETRTTTVSIPADLEIPQDVDAGTLQDLVGKLETSGLGFTPEQISTMKDAVSQLFNDAANAINDVSKSPSKKGLLFDIYALMALMIDVAQTQRDAARDMRTAENLAIQKSIQDQADQQRSAAFTGMVIGVVCGSISAAASIGIMAGQAISAKTQNTIMQQSGADASKMQTQMLQNTDSPANATKMLTQTQNKVGQEVATRVTQDYETQLKVGTDGDLGAKIEQANARVAAAKDGLDTAKGELQNAQTNLDQKVAARDALQQQVDAKRPELAEAQDSLDAVKGKQEYIKSEMQAGREPDAQRLAEFDARIGDKNPVQLRAELSQLEGKLADANNEVTAARENVQTKQGDVRIAQENLKASEADLATARSDYTKSVNDVAAQYKEKYQTAIDRRSNPPEGATKAELEADVKNARNEMEMAFAKQAQLLSKDGVMTVSQQKDLVASARSESYAAQDRVYQRQDFKEAGNRISNLMALNNINQSVGGMLQSVANYQSQILQSDATRQGAETQRQEEMLDQTKDLFQQEQKLIDEVIQLCQAVISAENQSMRDAIHV